MKTIESKAGNIEYTICQFCKSLMFRLSPAVMYCPGCYEFDSSSAISESEMEFLRAEARQYNSEEEDEEDCI